MHFDVLVVGGGHAGCEAALAARRLGRSVALVTLRADAIGRLSCNPAMGGLAKGTLVREIDALGGAMARVTDASTIHFRRLNTRKGLAVQASRAQVDVALYPARMQATLDAAGVTVVEGEVSRLMMEAGRVAGCVLGDGSVLRSGAVVLTTGTFLGGVLHRGAERSVGGRAGEPASEGLGAFLRAQGFRVGRLKTGTPPRVDGRTVDWDLLEEQPDEPGAFSFGDPPPRPGSRSCALSHTNAAVHDTIRAALDRSPLFTGAITGRGPRYCPSIEDKVVRFADRERHVIFLEPEGLDTDRVYVNGLSTSLPMDAQEAMLRAVPGLTHARVLQWGYAVEYDWLDPLQLGHDLQCRDLPGLYCAGQINGTSGYEEAAAQGLVAGVHAAGVELRLGRDEACIGVLIDDLVTRGVGEEPYRMFPSRAEHRLLLREDNADRRLTPLGRAAGLVDDAAWARFERHLARIEALRAELDATDLVPDAAANAALAAEGLPELGGPRTAAEYLRRPEVDGPRLMAALRARAPERAPPDEPHAEAAALEQVETDVKYAGYVVLAERRRDAARALESQPLAGIDLDAVPLSFEVRERLARHRPATLGAASRLPGVTPAAIDALAVALARDAARAATNATDRAP
jgi:tRNA uridine 5-carboxymethylaminomethyl modification enzyme